MKRQQKRLPNMGQSELGFDLGEAHRPTSSGARAHFLEDSPEGLRVGSRPLDEYLKANGLSWVIDLRRELASLDYTALEVSYRGSGRRPFHPRTVLGLMVYAVLVRQWSLREIEQLTVRDVGAWWICGGHQPDHSTIGKFVQLHAEALSSDFFQALVRWVVARVKLRVGTASIDGTVIESAASHWQAIRAEAAQLAAAQAAEAARTHPDEELLQDTADATARVAAVAAQRCAARKQVGKDSATVRVAPSDMEAVVQPRKDGAMRPAYKATSLMHESGVLLGQYVHPSSEPTAVLPLLRQHQAVLGAAPTALLMDAGFHSGPLLGVLVEHDVNVLCPSGRTLGEDDWEKKGVAGRFAKSQFCYEPSSDTYQCPTGEPLKRHGQGRDGAGRAYRVYRTPACASCTLRAQCTASRDGRSIKRYAGDEYKEAMAEVLRQPRARGLYRQRMRIAEPVHAHYRDRQALRRFRRRGLVNVRAEFALHGIAFNLKKVLGVPAFLLAVVIVTHQRGTPYRVALLWVLLAPNRASGL